MAICFVPMSQLRKDPVEWALPINSFQLKASFLLMGGAHPTVSKLKQVTTPKRGYVLAVLTDKAGLFGL